MKHLSYTADSLKLMQCPATESRLFYAQIGAVRPCYATECRQSLGVLGSGNAPLVISKESTPILFSENGNQPKTKGGHHA